MLREFSKDWNTITITSKRDKEKVFEFLSSEEIFKKLMPCYLQSVDTYADEDHLDRTRESTNTQLKRIYCSDKLPGNESEFLESAPSDKLPGNESEFLESTPSESEFLESTPSIQYWSDESYYLFRRDLVILDNYKLIDLFSRLCKIDNYKDACESLAKYTATYIKDLVYPMSESDYDNEGTKIIKLLR